jgi:SAM-dependent methyltransferase
VCRPRPCDRAPALALRHSNRSVFALVSVRSVCAADEAARDQQGFYDGRSERGYMQDFSDFFEACRVVTVRETLAGLDDAPRRVLDYGCGEGRYLDVIRERFPSAQLVGSDVSRVALEHAGRRHPDAGWLQMEDERVPEADGAFDLIISVEVLEHVANVERAASELGRLLAPGGRLVLTTPCANPGSLEWFLNRRRGGLQRTDDGFGRFATDEPGHLRRLTSRDVRVLLARSGLIVDRIDFRAQFFATIIARLPGRVARRLSLRAKVKLALLDWRLFRRLPNGATMVVVAHRPIA